MYAAERHKEDEEITQMALLRALGVTGLSQGADFSKENGLEYYLRLRISQIIYYRERREAYRRSRDVDAVSGSYDSIEALITREGQIQLLQKIRAALSEAQQKVFDLLHQEPSLSRQDIANMLHTTPERVGAILHRMRITAAAVLQVPEWKASELNVERTKLPSLQGQVSERARLHASRTTNRHDKRSAVRHPGSNQVVSPSKIYNAAVQY